MFCFLRRHYGTGADRIFLSNRVDDKILQHMIESQAEFIMEVTDKTKADIKVTLDLLIRPVWY